MRSSLETPYELKVRYHSFWLMAAIAYPAWAAIAELMDPEVTNRWREFLWASPIFLLALLFSRFAHPRMRTMRAMHAGLAFSLTLHYFLLLKTHGLSPATVIGCFILVFSMAATFATRRGLLLYSAFAVVLSVTLASAKGSIPPALVIIGLLMSLAISFVGVWDRLNAISRLREIQKKLESANQNIEGILSSVQEGFATLDSDLKFTYMNSAGITAVGSRAADFNGKRFRDVFPYFDGSQLGAAVLKSQQELVPTAVEDFYPQTNGGTWWETRIYPKEQGGISIFFRDITEVKRIQQKLKEQEAKTLMSAKMSTLGEMASGIAHEINNPLAIIYARAELLGTHANSDNLTNEIVLSASQKICETVMRIGRIVKGLRAFARDGDQDPFENIPVRSLLQDTLELCSQRFAANNVNLKLPELNPLVNIECRPVQVSQIILNLLNNAFDAVNSTTDSKWIEISCTDFDHTIEFRVANAGPAIDLNIRAKLFQPFFTTKDPNRGTGLGLSIARGLAETHGGTLEFDELARNTTFVLTLPRRQLRDRNRVA